MGIPVLILGESGSGKTTGLRNFEPGEILVFSVANKPLPFRQKTQYCQKRDLWIHRRRTQAEAIQAVCYRRQPVSDGL